MKTTVLAGIALALASGPAFAQSTPWVDARELNQATRIHRGVAAGQLTLGETLRLARGQAHVHAMEQRFKSDGVVTPIERARLHIALNRQSNRIWRLRHN